MFLGVTHKVGGKSDQKEGEMESAESKPRVKLTGRDGNAFAVIAACKRASKEAGWDDARWDAVQKEMTSGSYDHLIKTALEHFEVS